MIERKIIDAPGLSLKADDATDGGGMLTGYASTFGNVDAAEEIVMAGAFKDTVAEFLEAGFIALGHDWRALPIATPTSAEEDKKGLLISAEFHTTPDAQNARTVVRERLDRGKAVKMSIGYEVLEDSIRNEKGGKVRELHKLKLYEVSVVTVPANPLADVTGAKSFGLPVGLTLKDHSDGARAVLDEWIERLDSLNDYRRKESRVLSAQSLSDIDAAIESARVIVKRLEALRKRASPADDDEKAKLAAAIRRAEIGLYEHLLIEA